MAGNQEYDLNSINSLSPEQQQELVEEMEDQKEDDALDNAEFQQEFQEGYPVPTPDEKHNQHSFLYKAAFETPDTIRTTFLTESELGRPSFSVRFLSDLYDLSKYYLDPILIDLGKDPNKYNGIANYFWEKTQNITHSGMSNKGFAMNLNVTQRKDMTRKRIKSFSKDKDGKFKGGDVDG